MEAGDPLVGRALETGALRRELEAAFCGEGRFSWIEGEPGIGKTRLLRRLADASRELGGTAIWGRCHEQAGRPEYWPWIQAFESCDQAAGREAAAQLTTRLGEQASLDAGDPERARFSLYHDVTKLLARVAQAGPLLVVLDDLQWSDPGSLGLLEFVARELPNLPVLGVAAWRPAGGEPFDRLRGLGRGLTLQGLSAAETAGLLARQIGRAPAPTLAEQVHTLTSGNPFFVIEMAQLLGPVGSDDPEGDAAAALPPRTREILGRRLARLPEASLAALRIASVFGLEFRLELLAAALAVEPVELLNRLEAPIAAGIVQLVPGALQVHAFSHALMRDALYEALPGEVRARAHLAVAEALEAGGEALDGDRVFALAHHAFEAARIGNAAAAVRHGCAAGERALERLAFGQAETWFERALSAAALLDPPPLEQRVRALIGSGIAGRWNGSDERSQRRLREGIALARSLEAQPFAETVLRVALQRAEFQVLDIECNELLAEALRRLPGVASPLRVRLMARLASGLHLQPGAERERLAMSREAIAMARAIGDADALAFARSRGLANLLTPDHREELAGTVREILEDPATKPGAELEARLFELDELAQRADRKALDAALAVFEQRAETAGLPYFQWQVGIHRTSVALLEGRFAEAEPLARAAFVTGGRIAPQSAGLRFAAQLMWLRGWQGRLAEVAPLVERGVDRTQVLPAWRSALAGLYAHLGRETEARREFDALAAHDFRDLPRDSTWLVAMALLADVCVCLGDRERAEVLHRELLPWSGRVVVAVPLLVLETLVDIRLGALARLLGRDDDAIVRHQAALHTAERMRALPWQAEAHYHLALSRLARGERAEALASLERAESIARPIGMALMSRWVAEARGSLERRERRVAVATGTHGGRRQANVVHLPRARSAADCAIFRREGDVWSLAFEGGPIRLRHMRGLAHLARLIAEPGREIHAADLAGTASSADVGDAGAQLDPHARAEYEERLRELREEREEAERLHDRGRFERCSQEIEWLAGELSRGFGLGGRERRAGAASERARQSVTRAIKYAIDKIEPHEAGLADHLRRNVRTGTFCSYAPADRDRVTWTL